MFGKLKINCLCILVV